MKTENKNETRPSDQKRVFHIPAGYELERLAQDLADWLKTDQGMETEVIALKEGWLIQGKTPAGRLNRLIHRKAETLHVALFSSGSRVTVWLVQGAWEKADPETADPETAKDSGQFRFRNVASYARQTAQSVAETAATGISDLWTGSQTADAVFAFIGRHIADQFRAVSGSRTEADICYAKDLGRLGKQPEAVRLLESRLSELPDETLADLLPAPDVDLTKGEGGQLMRIRMLELLVDLRGVPDTDDVDTLRALAVLQPLVPERLRRLRAAAEGPVKDRADTVLNLLESGGFGTASTQVPPQGSASPLSPEDIQGRIRHPASREGTAIHKLQGMLAARKVPDHSSLKSFAKRVTPKNYPEVAAAICDGTVLFRMSSVEAYIAFGDLDNGIRGYEAKPCFILISGNHFDAESPVFMTPAELRFLIGGELGHIKFGHERITSREVWEGVFDKALTFVELMPVFGTYLSKLGRFGRMAGQATQMAKKVRNVRQYVFHAQSVLATTQDIYRRKSGTAAPPPKRTEEEDLVGAFRVMQLTADRAGLILSGDPGAAVRAIFKSNPGLVPDLPTAEQYGLFAFLSRTDDQGALMYQELAVRVAALFSFYLSEEYQQLKTSGYSYS